MTVKIRNYQPGDEAVQAEIYNEVAGALPKFKVATVDEVRRRCQAADFDPSTRFYAEENGQIVGYATFQANGRVSFPWCRPGHESAAEPLYMHVEQALKERGVRAAIAAYRVDWSDQGKFFETHGYHLVREMINYVMELSNMPTRSDRPVSATAMRREDIPAVFALAPSVLRVTNVQDFEQHLFHNRYFPPEALFVLRNRKTGEPSAAGILVHGPNYADPTKVDSMMPCFRLGAFGSEGMTTKRINGLFSFLAPNEPELLAHAMSLLEFVAARLENLDMDTIAAQVPSDVPHLVRFYRQNFTRQGSFPIYEKALA